MVFFCPPGGRCSVRVQSMERQARVAGTTALWTMLWEARGEKAKGVFLLVKLIRGLRIFERTWQCAPSGRPLFQVSCMSSLNCLPARMLVRHPWQFCACGFVFVVLWFGSGAMWGGLFEAPPFAFSRICQNKQNLIKHTLAQGWPTFGRTTVAVREPHVVG